MLEVENTDYSIAQTEDILVSAYHEQIDSVDEARKIWGYCLRIENNSQKRLTLTTKDFCITDSNGNTYHDCGLGFDGELPDLEPGEYFEFEDTAVINANTAILYGFCHAQTADGKKLKIKLPLIELSENQAPATTNLYN
ncbi:MAG: ApaG domain [Alphaproteobacteria bacterium]|nr:ApaG domain [Alphaproteobacteria bacterium]